MDRPRRARNLPAGAYSDAHLDSVVPLTSPSKPSESRRRLRSNRQEESGEEKSEESAPSSSEKEEAGQQAAAKAKQRDDDDFQSSGELDEEEERSNTSSKRRRLPWLGLNGRAWRIEPTEKEKEKSISTAKALRQRPQARPTSHHSNNSRESRESRLRSRQAKRARREDGSRYTLRSRDEEKELQEAKRRSLEELRKRNGGKGATVKVEGAEGETKEGDDQAGDGEDEKAKESDKDAEVSEASPSPMLSSDGESEEEEEEEEGGRRNVRTPPIHPTQLHRSHIHVFTYM